jgi:hypothetical protein
MRVQVGFSGADSGIDIEMEDSESFVKDLESALEAGKPLIWADNVDGSTYGIAVSKVTYIHLEGDTERLVGFA